jgi:hypothetical protein
MKLKYLEYGMGALVFIGFVLIVAMMAGTGTNSDRWALGVMISACAGLWTRIIVKS